MSCPPRYRTAGNWFSWGMAKVKGIGKVVDDVIGEDLRDPPVVTVARDSDLLGMVLHWNFHLFLFLFWGMHFHPVECILRSFTLQTVYRSSRYTYNSAKDALRWKCFSVEEFEVTWQSHYVILLLVDCMFVRFYQAFICYSVYKSHSAWISA